METLNRFLFEGYGIGFFTHVLNHFAREIELGIYSISPVQDIGMIATKGMTLKEYLDIISSQRYSAILYDYSIISIECQIKNGKIIRHRYIYIPCPLKKEIIAGRPDEIEVADFLSQIDKSALETKILSQGYLRFDFTSDTPPDGVYHPKSHLTFISSDCRIGLKAPLSIAEFLTFIFDNFYPKNAIFWHDFQPHLKSTCSDTILDEETSRMHLYWMESA